MRIPFSRSIFLGLLAILALLPSQVRAQSYGGPIDIQLFRPAIDSKGYITLNASQVLRHLDLSFGLVLNWSRRPLKLSEATIGGPWHYSDNSLIPSQYMINNLFSGNLQAALGLYKHFEVGVGLPLTLWNGETSPVPNSDSTGKIDAQGAGDLALHFKGRILNTSHNPVGLAAMISFTFPTGDKDNFLGTGRFGIAPTFIVDQDFWSGRLSLAANVGLRFLAGTDQWTDTRRCNLESPRQGETGDCGTNLSIKADHHLTYGLGAALALVPQKLSLVAELIGQTGLSNFAQSDKLNSAAEILGGLKLYLARNSFFTFGVGRGLRGGGSNYQYGSPDIRIFGAIIFEPSIGDRDGDGIKDDVDKCPDDPEDFDDFEDEDGCPDPDNDKDGIPDVVDKCPNIPEDIEGIEDEDGCPENKIKDRDGDGIPDDEDKCPDEPEDRDGFEDEDGCPDPDNDKDGILDVDDLCPNEPEDYDGFEDKDGCPDPDNDKDRIIDKDDKCPNEAEVYNGFEDEDGCPDKGRVVIKKGKIEILEKIYFETAKAIIKPMSYPILDAVAATLKGNPEIQLIEIQGHADERGSDDYNLKLTDDRAHAVLEYLTAKGVEPHRLQAKGYGETKPVDPSHNEAAWSKNRRVEFIILKRGQ